MKSHETEIWDQFAELLLDTVIARYRQEAQRRRELDERYANYARSYKHLDPLRKRRKYVKVR